jgi:hypothetical protein
MSHFGNKLGAETAENGTHTYLRRYVNIKI